MVLHRQILACLPRPAHKYQGAYPLGFEQRIHKIIQTKDYIHLFSGKSKTGYRIDIKNDIDVKPDCVADCYQLPFKDESFSGGMADPIYTQEFADNLYKQPLPKWNQWTKELVRVVKTGGLIGIMQNYEVNRLQGCQYWDVHYIANRPKHYPRIITVFVKTTTPDYLKG